MASFHNHGASQSRWDGQSLSLTVGWMLGIRIRVHLVAIILGIGGLVFATATVGPVFALIVGAIVTASVLLHEFGHCFACRALGGHADDVLLWPLGGLAFCDPPNRPKEHLITSLGGPAVNFVLCVAFGLILQVLGGFPWQLLNPFGELPPFPESYAYAAHYVAMGFMINYWLLLFNLVLPMYPLDGGRILHCLLWQRMPHYNATIIAASIGIALAFIIGVVSLWNREALLASVCLYCGLTSYRMRRDLELNGRAFENEFGYDFSEGYTSLERSMPKTRRRDRSPSLGQRLDSWHRRRRERQEAQLEAELDQILEKIHQQGMESLTRQEHKVLARASKRRRGSRSV